MTSPGGCDQSHHLRSRSRAHDTTDTPCAELPLKSTPRPALDHGLWLAQPTRGCARDEPVGDHGAHARVIEPSDTVERYKNFGPGGEMSSRRFRAPYSSRRRENWIRERRRLCCLRKAGSISPAVQYNSGGVRGRFADAGGGPAEVCGCPSTEIAIPRR